LNIFVFKSSPVSIKAFIGKEGWLYFSGEELKTFTGTDLFSENELKEFEDEIRRRQRIIESHGAKLFIAIVPNKANIYPEYMPDHIIKANNLGYGQQILKYFKQQQLPVIDLYQPLIEAKSLNEIYYRTDNHWNDLGAFVASNAILNSFSTVNKNVKPLSLDTYQVIRVKDKAGDVAEMLTMEDDVVEFNFVPTRKGGLKSFQKNLDKYKCVEGFPYPWEYEYTRYTDNDSLPSVLIIRDSFGAKVYPFVSEECRKCTAIFDAWHYGLNEDIIKGEKPDIVLFLILESQLKNLMKYKKLEK
jgi:alginate O-acetyltransferase complex protein AlgJ